MSDPTSPSPAAAADVRRTTGSLPPYLPRDSATILAIDPGTTRSAWVMYRSPLVIDHQIAANEDLIEFFRHLGAANVVVAVIEQVASYGMAVGAETFETVRWAGRFEEALHPTPVALLTRKTIVLHLCNSPRASDSNVRRALMDKFGGDAAIGLKKTPGPLYGFRADLWAALAVAVAYAEGARNPELAK